MIAMMNKQRPDSSMDRNNVQRMLASGRTQWDNQTDSDQQDNVGYQLLNE